MKNKFLVTIILFFYISITFSQNNLDTYKYVIIPNKFESFKEENKYQLNSLTKFLFNKKGYQILTQNEKYPTDLIENPCLAVTAAVNDNSSMFTSKLIIELKDCYNKVAFTSKEGRSKEKNYKKSYQEALRNAFVSIDKSGYDSKQVKNNDVVAQTPKLRTPAPKKASAAALKETNAVKKQITKANPSKQHVAKSRTRAPKAIPIVVEKPVDNTIEKQTENLVKNAVANSYKNDKISFFLIEQNNSLVAYANSSNGETYKKGEKIGILKKTSRPNSYRISWKNKEGNFENTTGYFDKKGNLNIDIEKNGEIEVIIFEIEN